MALEGTLKDFSLADIFQLIGLQRKTGVLTLRGKDDTVTVTFLDGKVVSADSLNRRLENRLGHVLIKTGTLTTEQLNRALEIQRETLQRLGFILTHYGIISQDDLRHALQLQILQIIYRLFRWKDGDYHFSQETTIEYDRENVAPISAESVLMEGARMIDEWPIIEKKIRSYDMVFQRRELPGNSEVVAADHEDRELEDGTARRKKIAATGVVKVSTDEKMVYELVDGKRTVSEIVEASRLSEFDTNKALYDLLNHELIEEVRETFPTVVVEELPVEEPEPEEQSAVPAPLVAALAIIALISLATSWRNPLNLTSEIGSSKTFINEARKAVSFQRIRTIGEAIESYDLVNDDLPDQLSDLAPNFLGSDVLEDPWGNAYKFLQPPGKYLVIGFTPDGRADTDLFFSRTLDNLSTAIAQEVQPTGGIELID
jgi:hypothetical protein